MDRLHKIHFIERKATWRIHMVRGETYKETTNLSSRQCMARYVEAYAWCSEKESKNKDGLSRNRSSTMPDKEEEYSSLNQTTKNSSSQWKPLVESSLQNTDKKQWRNPPRYWETQDKIRLCCWCRRKHETKARRSWTQTSSRSHHCKRDEFYNSIQSSAQVHSDASSIKNSRCNGGSGEEWWKLEKIPAWQLTKVRNKKEVIAEARNEGKTVHFASLVDLCHLKNSELEPQYQKYKGRVVLRGDILKDDSGSYAVFTEQGSSAFQMTAAKVMDMKSRLPESSGQAADAVSAETQVKMEDAPTLLKIPKSERPDIWIRLPKNKWPKSWSCVEGPVVPLERTLCGHPLAGLLWERQFWESSTETRLGKSSQLGLLICKPRKTIPISACGRYQTGRQNG